MAKSAGKSEGTGGESVEQRGWKEGKAARKERIKGQRGMRQLGKEYDKQLKKDFGTEKHKKGK